MRVLLPFERPGLQRGTDDPQRADAGVAGVGEDDLAGAAGGDHLVIDQVGRGAGQHQLAPSLSDDLVPGGKRNQVGEAGSVDQVAIVDVSGDGVMQGSELGHGRGHSRTVTRRVYPQATASLSGVLRGALRYTPEPFGCAHTVPGSFREGKLREG